MARLASLYNGMEAGLAQWGKWGKWGKFSTGRNVPIPPSWGNVSWDSFLGNVQLGEWGTFPPVGTFPAMSPSGNVHFSGHFRY